MSVAARRLCEQSPAGAFPLVIGSLRFDLTACPRTLKLMMAASLMVRMQVPEKAPPVVFRRGLGVRGGGPVVSLP